jgi:TetR/AcrR family transcriptional repressor of nem operon
MSMREQLVTAAKELLWERGYEAMSPRAVLERSGAGQGSLYHHFGSKTQLAATALNDVSDEMQQTLRTILSANKPPLDRVRDFLKQPRDALRGCRLGRLTQEQVLAEEILRQPLAAFFAAAESELAAVLEQAQKEGSLATTVNAADLAATLIAVVQGGYVLARALQDPGQMEQAIRGALALLDAIERRKQLFSKMYSNVFKLAR